MIIFSYDLAFASHLPASNMKEISHQLCILQCGKFRDGFFTREWLIDLFNREACTKNSIKPLRKCSIEEWCFELPEFVSQPVGRCGENPFVNSAVCIVEIAAYFNGISFMRDEVAKVSSMRCSETR